MATLTSRNPTLLDLAQARDPNGKIATVVEILNEKSDMLDDMTWLEGNLVTGHTSTIRAGLPQPTWRKMYGGVQPTKSVRVKVTDSVGMLEAFSEVDVALADLNGNANEFRLSEDKAHIEGMNQELQETLLFGNVNQEPEAFTGFGPRFNDLSAENADNIIDAGGTGVDNTSVWLVVWGTETCHGIVPKGSTAGIQVEDLGKKMIQNSDGSRFLAYVSHYRWDAGLTVRDWRFVVRVCNIDKSALAKDAASGADLPDLLFQALSRIPSLAMGRPAFYMSLNTLTFLRRQASAAVKSSSLTVENVGGTIIERFHGVPLRRIDALAADEARVT